MEKRPMLRRLRFMALVMLTQVLLIAMSISWLLHMVTIAVNGSAYFIENNTFILWAEISASALITVFAIFVLALQIQRLGERRNSDRALADRRTQSLTTNPELPPEETPQPARHR